MLASFAFGAYYWYASRSASTPAKYVLQNATLGTVVSSVAGSGQVQPGTSVDIKPQVTETVTKLYVRAGDRVKAGQALVELDSTNEAKALRQAELSLQSAQLSLEKLQQPPDQLTLIQDQNAAIQADEQLAAASSTLVKDYQAGFDSVAAAFVDFQTVMNQLQEFVTGNDINKAQQNPDALVTLMPSYLQASMASDRDDVVARYNAALAAYKQNLTDYHAANRNSDPVVLDALFAETLTTAKFVSNTVQAGKNMLDYMTTNYPKGSGYAPLPPLVATFETNFGNYTATTNNDIANIANTVNTISSDKTSVNNSRLSLAEKQQALAELQAGATAIDLKTQQIAVEQQKLALQTAEQNYAATTIRSPIDGVVASISAVAGEIAASPAVTVVGDGELAEVTLNEVDAATVAVGDKATLTFDAVAGLSLAGTVDEIDPVGTVSQGVVNYNVKIGFAETTTTREVKPGMSVAANIVTAVHQSVVVVPNTALVKQGSATYVQVPAGAVPAGAIASSSQNGVALPGGVTRVPVVAGISDSANTEIISGVRAGDVIVARTMAGAASAASMPTTGAFRAGGGGGFFLGGGGHGG